jgi:diguanylate cyclase (GGDEF)-like protein
MTRLRRLLTEQGDPYAGVDLANAARLGGVLWIVASVIVVALLPAAPPDDAIGDAGWVVGVLTILGGVASGLWLRRAGPAVSPNVLYLHSVSALTAVAVMVWLSGGMDSPYEELYLLSVVFTAMLHPPRRVLLYLALLGIAVFAPLVYDHWDSREAASLATSYLLWSALSLVGLFFMAGVRRQRLGLRSEGEKARRQARMDSLTGLENRRAFDEALAAEIEIAKAAGRPLSVVVADLDSFKAVNDRHGHLEGDRVLRSVGDAILSAIRGPDAAFRWGGDEFAVLLPGTPLEAARHVAERVQAAVDAEVHGPDGGRVGIAFGAAELSDLDAGPDTLLAAADDALIEAKGRKQTFS